MLDRNNGFQDREFGKKDVVNLESGPKMAGIGNPGTDSGTLPTRRAWVTRHR